MFTFDDKQYDETKLSEEGKVAFVQLQNLAQRRNQLSMEYDNLQILSNHYTDILKKLKAKLISMYKWKGLYIIFIKL